MSSRVDRPVLGRLSRIASRSCRPNTERRKFLDAAQILSTPPEAMQLRYLSTLMTIANERSRTIVFPLPRRLDHLQQRRQPGRRG